MYIDWSWLYVVSGKGRLWVSNNTHRLEIQWGKNYGIQKFQILPMKHSIVFFIKGRYLSIDWRSLETV